MNFSPESDTEFISVSNDQWRFEKNKKYYRVVVTLRVKTSTVDLFHNSTNGYRAQYYQSPERGNRANAYALEQMIPKVLVLLEHQPKLTCPLDWVEKSLRAAGAKLWIYQGLWLRRARRDNQQLLVERWIEEQNYSDPERRKKARWACLLPNRENRIILKGGYLTLNGSTFGESKPARAREIHELGFT